MHWAAPCLRIFTKYLSDVHDWPIVHSQSRGSVPPEEYSRVSQALSQIRGYQKLQTIECYVRQMARQTRTDTYGMALGTWHNETTVPAAEKGAIDCGGGTTASFKRLESNAKQYSPMPITRLVNATDASPIEGAKVSTIDVGST